MPRGWDYPPIAGAIAFVTIHYDCVIAANAVAYSTGDLLCDVEGRFATDFVQD